MRCVVTILVDCNLFSVCFGWVAGFSSVKSVICELLVELFSKICTRLLTVFSTMALYGVSALIVLGEFIFS